MMLQRMMRATCLWLMLCAPVAMAQGVMLPPERTGVVDRYDSVHKLLYVDGQAYALTGQAAAAVAELFADKGATGLRGKNVAYGLSPGKQGRATIDVLVF